MGQKGQYNLYTSCALYGAWVCIGRRGIGDDCRVQQEKGGVAGFRPVMANHRDDHRAGDAHRDEQDDHYHPENIATQFELVLKSAQKMTVHRGLLHLTLSPNSGNAL